MMDSALPCGGSDEEAELEGGTVGRDGSELGKSVGNREDICFKKQR
jgi:hypothetical protein